LPDATVNGGHHPETFIGTTVRVLNNSLSLHIALSKTKIDMEIGIGLSHGIHAQEGGNGNKCRQHEASFHDAIN
jgi:hypothetical protein